MYEIYEKLLEIRGVKSSDVSKATGISNMTLSDWKNGKSTPKPDKLSLLADYFEVTLDFLQGKEERIFCKECGYFYNPIDKESIQKHSITHNNWNNMEERHGFKWTYEECMRYNEESKKYVKFNQFSGDDLDTAHYDMLFKCLYWRFLYYRNFDSNVDFKTFRDTAIIDKVELDIISDDNYEKICEYYNVDTSYSIDSALTTASLNNNSQLMRILNYAKRINPQMLDTIEIQLKALAEQNDKE